MWHNKCGLQLLFLNKTIVFEGNVTRVGFIMHVPIKLIDETADTCNM